MKKEESIINPLQNKKVTILQVAREGSWPMKGKAGADGLYPGAGHFFCGTPYDVNKRRHIDPLTKEEKDFFCSEESQLNLEKDQLNMLKEKNFWTDLTIKLTDDPLFLDLNDEMDYLRWRFLSVQGDVIAPSWNVRKNKATYKFVIKDLDEVTASTIKKIQKEKEVMRHYYKIETNATQLTALLKMYYYQSGSSKKVSNKTSVSTLSTELYNVIENNLDRVHEILQDKHLDTKLSIYEGIEKGVIEKPSRYEFQIVGREEVLNMTDMVKFLSSAKNSDVLLELRAKTDNV